ncbi:MAG: ABC transporter permease, partial [Gemmatimonadales bacterium]
MSLVRQISRGLHALFRPAAADREIDDEIRHFAAETEAEHRAAGVTDADARRTAHREVGNVTAVRETIRDSGWEHGLETTLRDVRYTLRSLRRSPVFTITAIVTLAIGIGASTAVFSAVAPSLLEPLPFPHASRLVALMDRNATGDASPPTLGSYQEVRDRARSFDAVAAADGWQPALTDNGDPERLDGQRVTANFFATFGVTPMLGRTFTADDDRPGGPHVVVLSASLWNRRFGSDRGIIGRSIELGGNAPWLVIGVLSPTFASLLAPKAEIWSPMQERADADFSTRAWGHHYQIVARLAPGATIAGANRELLRIGKTPDAAWPRPRWADLAQGLQVTSLRDRVVGSARTPFYAIVGAVLLLL